MEATDSSSINGNFALPKKTLPAGWYKIIVTTTDKYGEAVKAEKYIRLTDKKENKINEPIISRTHHFFGRQS